MGKGFFQVPTAINEIVKSYAPGSPEREAVANNMLLILKDLSMFQCILEKKKLEPEIQEI